MAWVNDPIKWNDFVRSQHGSFLQSWDWGEFQQSVGHVVRRWQGDGAGMQCIVQKLPLGRTAIFSPYGPFGNQVQNNYEQLQAAVSELAGEHNAIYWRIEPQSAPPLGKAVNSIHPQYSWRLELTNEEQLLSAMKQKWRYNIRLAERKGVVVRSSHDPADAEAVYGLLDKTAKHQQITIHSKEYYRSMIEQLRGDAKATIWLAEREGDLLAGAVMVGFGNTLTYVHGGSDYQHRALMAPHAMQWHAIKDAVESGYQYYDFFGIAPPTADKSHPWGGITRFKKGFGGELVERAGTYEIPLNRLWYTMYGLAKLLRKK